MSDNQDAIHTSSTTNDDAIPSPSTPILLRRQPSTQPSDKRPHTPDATPILGLSSPTHNQTDPPTSNELDEFILGLLKKPQERIFLLKLEQDLEAFINNYQPSVRFPDLVEQDQESEETPKFRIMRRSPLPHAHGAKRLAQEDRKPMTYEERKAAYEEARARIFCDVGSQSSGREDEDE
ncbi:hypothetical protein DFQ29_007759 [Apophysomyces sp. BC1021]|nr:hypothetical protein DFQ29_007759 [Apophysomyces sp. BC1021]